MKFGLPVTAEDKWISEANPLELDFSLINYIFIYTHTHMRRCARTHTHTHIYRGSLVAQLVKNLPANAGDAKDWVRSLSWEDTLEEGMVTCPSILAWEIPWTLHPGRLQSIGLQRVGHN